MAKKLLPIIIRDHYNIPIYQGDISDIGIKNDYIIEKSIEWYNDPTPCHRHREGVRGRIVVELVDYLQRQKRLGTTRVRIEFLPVPMRRALSFYRDAVSIEIR